MTVIDPKISTHFSIIRGKYCTLAIFVSLFLAKLYFLSKPIFYRIFHVAEIHIRAIFALYQGLSFEKCWHWFFVYTFLAILLTENFHSENDTSRDWGEKSLRTRCKYFSHFLAIFLVWILFCMQKRFKTLQSCPGGI